MLSRILLIIILQSMTLKEHFSPSTAIPVALTRTTLPISIIARLFARENSIKVFDVNFGIGTHIAIDNGLPYREVHLFQLTLMQILWVLSAAFGQGMGDQDIAAAWANGSVWFKVPESVKLSFTGNKPSDVTAKDIVLNLLSIFGANKLLGFFC